MNTQFSQQRVLTTDAPGASTAGWNRLTRPVFLQRIENAALAVLLLLTYSTADFAWWLLVVLVLVPDLSIIAYAKGNLVGARVYNALHNYTGPVLLAVAGSGAENDTYNAVALIWALHIAIDRAVGFGLKYTTTFKHNHLSWK